MKKKLAILGAGGKMGSRVTANIKDLKEYEISYIEISEAGRKHLKENLGVVATDSYVSYTHMTLPTICRV